MKQVDSLYKVVNTKAAARFSPWLLFLGIGLTIISLGWSGLVFGAEKTKLELFKQVIPDGNYLVLFQNNSELRPAGGFIGSFATVKVENSQPVDIDIDTNIYKRDSAFTLINFIEVPDPLKPIVDGNTWAMRDSNWDIDFRDSAQRVSWFYLQEGGRPVDGVIAVNATVLADFLKLSGSVNLNGQSLDSGNILDFLHNQIERQYYQDSDNRDNNEPKEILKTLLPALLAKAKLPTNAFKVLGLIEQELREKHIQIYNFDPAIESKIIENGWAGDIKETDGDYLLVNNASIGGQKSSLNVFQNISVDIADLDGKLEHELTIKRTHYGDGSWPDFTNKNYTRVAVPLNSTDLKIDLNGQEIDYSREIDRGKLVVGFQFDTEPRSSSVAKLRYLTPAYSSYSLLYQKQSGVLTDYLEVSYLKKNLFDGPVASDTIVE